MASPSALLSPVWTGWRAGPAADPDGPVVVSFTEYTARSAWRLPAIAADGMRLREGWYAMEGAVGLLLYGQPTHRRCGSVSVWTSEAALRRFVGLPRHVEIMRKYRPAGVIRASTWHQERFDLADIRDRMDRWLAGRA